MCQLLNVDEKLMDEEQALLLLSSLSKDYRNIVQILLIGRDSITLDQVLVALRENDRFVVRREREEKKKNDKDSFFSDDINRGEPKKKDIKERESLKGGVTVVTKNFTIVRRRGTNK